VRVRDCRRSRFRTAAAISCSFAFCVGVVQLFAAFLVLCALYFFLSLLFCSCHGSEAVVSFVGCVPVVGFDFPHALFVERGERQQ
jgi:hypothetical protein